MNSRSTFHDPADDVPWALAEEHRQWQAVVRTFADEVVAPGATERSINEEFALDLQRQVGELGVFGLRVAEEYGGSASDVTSVCVAAEQLARVDGSFAGGVHAQYMTCTLLDAFATEEQKREILVPAVNGEKLVAFGLTEPQGGSDAGNLKTYARRDGDDWVVNGAKMFITNAGTPISSHVLTIVATGEGRPGRPSASMFLIPLDAPGVTVSGHFHKLGWRSSDTRAISFDDVRVPSSAMVGDEGRGYAQALNTLTWARLPIGAMSTGLAQGCLEETVRFVQERESFGRTLAEHQAVAFDVADIAAEVAVARTLTYDGCFKFDRGLPGAEQACAVVKLVAGELVNKVGYQATQLHGGYGFMDESPVTRHYRDARVLAIGEGTSHVQRMLIARGLGLPA
ncbi:MAG: acyl-CoA dehydrogenase family protein [Nocardioides sp.]|uniref:acyl-CoA dehydrogenase family protein n=1 Tax=Nocardioides sp. TaxID=35761 RepID=UPI0039E2CADF